MKKLSLLFYLSLVCILPAIGQIINPNNINYELYADEWRQECDNDWMSDDDNMVRIVVNTDASTGGTITWNFTNSCTSPYAYVRKWQADAPSSNTYANSIYSRVNSTSTTGALGYTVQSWETDNGFNCLPVSGDDCRWGPYTYTANYRDATRTPNQWWGVGGTNGSGDWSSTGQGRVRLKTIWRYTKGDNCSEPLDFGTLASGVAKTHFNSNKSIPSGARAEMGYTNTRDNAAPDVYYSFSITQPSTVVISTIHDNTTFDTYLRLLSSDCGTQIDFNDDFSGTRSQITRALCPGSYKILVEGYSTNTGNFNLSVQATTISTNGGTIATTTPSAICPGIILSPFTNTGAASGLGSIAYQWESSTTSSTSGFSNISGATALDYTPTNVAPTQTTWYRRRATDECGRVFYSNTIQITVNTNSIAPTAITGTTTICNGNSTTLTATGYTIGTGGTIKWYSASCGGTAVGTGASITVSPTANTTYYARVEGACNTTTCVSATITVNTLSTAPTSITGTTTICAGGSTTLTANGATLGTGASIKWYSSSCGGTAVGTGASITVSPTANTTYYARVEGTCNTTACVSATVTVNTLSTAPTSITGTTTICVGGSTTLTANGATLGTGASIKWYSASCGGTAVGTGTSITVSPTANTTYYARVEGTCNTTTCASVVVTVNSNSTTPTSITGTTTICAGGSTTLTANGATLGTGASIKWYSASCGGTAVGTGASITVSPTANTTYYARVEGTCNTTTCASVVVTVNTLSTAPTLITGTTTICAGGSTTLTANGATLGTGASIKWYSASCGGTAVGTGTSITVSPTANTTYYARIEGTCNTTTCASVVVTVNSNSTAPTSITGTTTICAGGSTTLTANGATLGTGASIKWYSASCGGTAVGTGASITVSPTANTTYYARVEGACNTTACVSATVTVNTLSTAPTSIAGITTICNSESTELTATGMTLGTGATIQWSTNTCGGPILASGNSIVVAPTTTTTYYARVVGACNTTTCASITVNVNTLSSHLLLHPVPTIVCPNTNTTLTVSGTLGTGASIKWYTAPNGGGTLVGTGTNVVVAPTSTTTYYARTEGPCGNSDDVAATLNVRQFVYAANNTSATDYCTDNDGWHHFYNGNQIILSVKGDLSNFTAQTATIRNNSTYYQDRPSGGNPANCVNNFTPGEERFEMSRNWNLYYSGGVSGTYQVRFYHTAAEKSAIINAAINFASSYPDCGYNYKYNAINDGFYWFKNASGNYAAPRFEDVMITSTTSGSINGINYTQLNDITSFSGGSGAIILTPNSTLPIELLSFDGIHSLGKSYLNWVTASEFNNSHFEVQRSRTGANDFETIGTVNSLGDSRSNQYYNFTDEHPYSGVTYYRLRQVDFDGSFTYSNIIALEAPLAANKTIFYPNPTLSNVTYQFISEVQEKVEISIINTLGQIMDVRTYNAEIGNNQVQISLDNFASGLYIINAKHGNNGHTVSGSIIKSKP